ncbi:uncharacterized protein At3g49055 [Oryza sativa Japonica Group]|uniref:Os08g0559800 protein n=3 Tax=Oryza TaxID=4527 RepID=A0A0P0XJC2_ORYSJ|nr:uncharacterized protein At3g49055 [Oryza sativa Japonica Group]KAF2920940.1 hypothetical protein DAI22_08g249700 [Oryza sativa Japonica Group]BAT06691.1 Os08g0559800 [Oryza sativa Japonica Group]
MDYQPKVAMHKITTSLHLVHRILDSILDRAYDDKLDRLYESVNNDDQRGGLKILASQAHHIHELAKEVQINFSGYMEMQRKEEKRFGSMISSLKKENQDIRSMLKIAVTEKEAAENRLCVLKGDKDQGRSAILQIAEKGLHKVGFGFIMDVITGESEREENMSSNSATEISTTGRESDQGVDSLTSVVGKTMENMQNEINDLRQALHKSRSDCDRLQLLAAEQAQKIVKYELHIKDLEEREIFLLHSVEELTVDLKEVEREAARWREACELEVEAGKDAIKQLNQEVALLTEELRRVKADLEAANSKLQLKEKLAATAMAAQAAADECLKLADSRSAGLQLRIEELTKQIEQEDEHAGKERGSAHRRTRYACWPLRRLRVISASSSARKWFVDQNGRLPPGTEALLQIRI